MTNIAMPPVDQAVIARRDEIVAGLVSILGAEHVISTEDERRAYETDALTAYRAVPLAVVLPGSTEEVSKVLAYLNGTGAKINTPVATLVIRGGAAFVTHNAACQAINGKTKTGKVTLTFALEGGPSVKAKITLK